MFEIFETGLWNKRWSWRYRDGSGDIAFQSLKTYRTNADAFNSIPSPGSLVGTPVIDATTGKAMTRSA